MRIAGTRKAVPNRGVRKQLPLLPNEFDIPEDSDVGVRRERMSACELFGSQCRMGGLPQLVAELRFAKSIGRQWRFDWAFPEYQLAVEIEGLSMMPRCRRCYPGQYVPMGRHSTAKGFQDDTDKYNTAALLGWTVLRFITKDVKPRHAINMTMRVLAARGWQGAAS